MPKKTFSENGFCSSKTNKPLVVLVAFLLAAMLTATAANARAGTVEQSALRVGQKIDGFELADYQNKPWSLGDVTGDKLVVVAFLGVECPLAKLYAPRIEELGKQYGSRGVAFVALDSNRQDALSEMAHFARQHSLTIPFLKDVGNVVADCFQAVRTPEVFVLDRDRTVRYRGRIDDQYGFQSGVGYQRPKAGRQDLATALDELLTGREVSQPMTPAPGCLIGRVRQPVEHAEVTYSNQIARIFQERCVSCHRPGEIGPFSLSSYDEVVGWADMIGEVVREERMPPWHADAQYGRFDNDSHLTDAQKGLVARWVQSGAPQGDPADLPPPRHYTAGWQISAPDKVVYMGDEPYTVPAEGKVEYQYFVADPGFTEDVWIKEAECRPGNRAVVHHIIVFVFPPGVEPKRTGEGMLRGDLLAGTAPGNPPSIAPDGMAKLVRAGSKLLFQMHYTANGSQQQDRSSIGLVFADPRTVTRDVKTDLAINPMFVIPAGADNQKVESWKRFREDSLVISLMPHMHLRGKSFRYELVYPDGQTEVLLDIPRYDFNWQNTYYLAEPKFVPAGSRMHCTAHFDNSENNLANPDPTSVVGWGEQTWEEMMIGWFVRAPAAPRDAATATAADDVSQRTAKSAEGG